MNARADINPLLDAAIGYAGRGWRVFPLGPGTKGVDAQGRSSHLLPDGHLGASIDAELIREWWHSWPRANIGLSLEASGLVALDADLYKPDCGWQAFTRGREMPDTLVQTSPRGGQHFIFACAPEERFPGKLCPGVEIKHRGYILLEPSTFQGGGYRFETDDTPAPVPDWVPRKDGTGHPNNPSSFALPSGSMMTSVATASEAEELLSWLDPDADGYEAWLEVLQALHDHFGGSDEGLRLAEAWSQRGASFTPGEIARKWRGLEVGGGITMRSVARRAGENGADLSEIARRHRGSPTPPRRPADVAGGDLTDLSHDQLALDLGTASWDANARYVALWGQWLFWSGAHWRRDDRLEHLTRARSFLRARAADIVASAERRVETPEGDGKTQAAGRLRKAARDQARTMRSSSTVAAVVGLARANPTSAVSHEAFDRDPYLLGTPDGTVDLRNGQLRGSRRDDMISRLANCSPAEPGTRPVRWLRFLDDVFEGDAITIGFMQRGAGYALTGSIAEHKLLFLFGAGRNGKSIFLNTLLHLWGDYGRRMSSATFLNSQAERHPTDIAGLQGARLAIASELPRGKTWDEAVIKDLTGGDRLTARFMRQDYFDFDPQMTLMVSGNTQPSFRGVDEAIRSRVVLVPFRVTIPPEKRDLTLQAALITEGPAILRWCIDGAVAWQERGLDVPASIATPSKAYFDEEDTLGQFLGDETVTDPQAIVGSDDLILRFNQWCELQGLGGWTKRTLIKELKLRGFCDAKSNGRRGLRGLRLR